MVYVKKAVLAANGGGESTVEMALNMATGVSARPENEILSTAPTFTICLP